MVELAHELRKQEYSDAIVENCFGGDGTWGVLIDFGASCCRIADDAGRRGEEAGGGIHPVAADCAISPLKLRIPLSRVVPSPVPPYYGTGAAVVGGLATGAVIGGAIANSQARANDAVGYCAQRYRSYDPASGTYLGYDGNRHPCP